jgi:outer membrane lipoprotein carrier protein
MFRSFRLDIVTLILTFWAAPLSAQNVSATSVMDKLREKFEKSGALSAHFRQTLDADYANSSSSMEGTIVLSGNKYRIETDGQTVITDGVTTWVYVAQDQQVIISDYVEDEGSFTPGHFLDNRSEKYEINYASERADDSYVVELKATSRDTFLETATLWIDKDEYLVRRIDVTDVNGAFMRFEMAEIDMRPDIGDSTFKFTPNEGIEVVDLR